MTILDILNVLDAFGTLGAMVVILWLLLVGKLVTRREYDRLEQELREWKGVAKPAIDRFGKAVEMIAEVQKRQADV